MMLLPDWGTVTLFLNESFEPSEEEAAALAARGACIEQARVLSVTDTATVELVDGRRVGARRPVVTRTERRELQEMLDRAGRHIRNT